MDKNIRICIVGPGAIGGVVAGVLARDGFNIQLVTKHPDLAEKISTSGIEITGYCGNFYQPVPSVASIGQLEGIFDYVLIATKADASVDAARELLPFLNENSRVVSLQNGICEERIARVVGEARTIGCVVGWRGVVHAQGKVEMTSGGECVLGNWNREQDEELERLAGIFRHLINTRISDEILSELYSKLIINACITSLGVCSGLSIGKILAKGKARKLFIEIIREAIQVASVAGLKVAPGAGGKVDYYRFLAPGPFSGLKRHLTLLVIGMKYRKFKSSSLRNLDRGRKTEVGYYNGYIVSKGMEYHVQTPVNRQFTRMVNEIEEGKRPVRLENLNEISLGPISGPE